MAVINNLPSGAQLKLDNLMNLGQSSTYYQDPTSSQGSTSIFYTSNLNASFIEKLDNNRARVVQDFKALVIISTTSSNVLNNNDYQTLEVNGVEVCATSRQTSLRNTLNVVYLDLKTNDVITGKVVHLSSGYRVYYNYQFMQIV